MFEKKGQFSVEFLLIFIFIMTVVSVLIVFLGGVSLDISLTEKREEVDDFANSVIVEFEIMQTVHGGYTRELVIPEHFMERFDISIDVDYLVVEDNFVYEDSSDFIRYYKIPGNVKFSTYLNPNGELNILLCNDREGFSDKNVDFFDRENIETLNCDDYLYSSYIEFAEDSSPTTSLNLEVTSVNGDNEIYFEGIDTYATDSQTFGDTGGIYTIIFPNDLAGQKIRYYFSNESNVEYLNFSNNDISYFKVNNDWTNLKILDFSGNYGAPCVVNASSWTSLNSFSQDDDSCN